MKDIIEKIVSSLKNNPYSWTIKRNTDEQILYHTKSGIGIKRIGISFCYVPAPPLVYLFIHNPANTLVYINGNDEELAKTASDAMTICFKVLEKKLENEVVEELKYKLRNLE